MSNTTGLSQAGQLIQSNDLKATIDKDDMREKLKRAWLMIDPPGNKKEVKPGKIQIGLILASANDVLNVVDTVAIIHPAVQDIVRAFRFVITMEKDRKDNNRRIAVLYCIMMDLLSVLVDLDPVFNQADPRESKLRNQLKSIVVTMNEFGNFCDLYYKHKGFVRILMSSRYMGQLKEYANTFINQHRELVQFLAVQKTDATVVETSNKLDTVASKVDAFLAIKSEMEKKVDDLITKLGGEEAVINDEKRLEKIAKEVGEKVTDAMKFTIRTDLQSQLSTNWALFHLKLDAVTEKTKETIERSTNKILLRLDAGPHELIEDPDIKEVWKEMGWKASCKSRHFVDAVHHHFANVFRCHELKTGKPHPDQWTLKFLSNVVFYPAIGDAIDEDGSGYIAIEEANHFFYEKHGGWSTPQWLAYWAAGWYKNAVELANRASSLLADIEKLGKTLHPQNLNRPYRTAEKYLKNSMVDTHLIVDSLYPYALDAHGLEFLDGLGELQKLCMERMDRDLKLMSIPLDKIKCHFKVAEDVTMISTERTEINVLALIYLILTRHKDILTLAQQLVLADEEFSALSLTLESIQQAFSIRLTNLSEYWRQQRLNTELQVKCFAGGIFEDWWKKYCKNTEDESMDGQWAWDDFEETGDDVENETESGQGGSGDGHDGTDALNATDRSVVHGRTHILVHALPLQPKWDPNAPATDAHKGLEDEEEAQEIPTQEPEDRIEAIEQKLDRIETLLEKLLAGQAGGSMQTTGDEGRSRQVASYEDESRQTAGYEDKRRQATGFEGESRQTAGHEDRSRQAAGFEDDTRQIAGYDGRSRQGLGVGYEDESEKTTDYEDRSGQAEFEGYEDGTRQMAGYEGRSRQGAGYEGESEETADYEDESGQMAGYDSEDGSGQTGYHDDDSEDCTNYSYL